MITIVFGKPGCGKTAYLTADAIKYMNGSEDCLALLEASRAEVRRLQNFTEPALSPVYSNYPIIVQHGYGNAVLVSTLTVSVWDWITNSWECFTCRRLAGFI